MIKAIIFDVGGVITKNVGGFKILAEQLNIDYDLIVKIWNENNAKLDTHKMTTEEFLNIVKTKSKIKSDIIGAWKNIYYNFIECDADVLKIIEKLKAKYRLAIISNATEFHSKLKLEKGVYSHFDVVVLSYQVGLAKPQKEIFEHALNKLKLNAGECIFIDDKIENIAAAKSLGFKAIHFKDAEQLASELKGLGVSI